MAGKKPEPLPEMVERQCKKCNRFTVVAKYHPKEKPVYCIEHDPELAKELGLDG